MDDRLHRAPGRLYAFQPTSALLRVAGSMERRPGHGLSARIALAFPATPWVRGLSATGDATPEGRGDATLFGVRLDCDEDRDFQRVLTIGANLRSSPKLYKPLP